MTSQQPREIARLIQDLRLDKAALGHPALAAASELSQERALELFASVAWSMLVEPGDKVATLLRQQLGAAAALASLVLGDEPKDWLDKLAAARHRSNNDQPADHESAEIIDSLTLLLGDSLPRWQPRLSLKRVIDLLDIAYELDMRLISPASTNWPAGLNDLGLGAPAMIWLRGQIGALAACQKSVAIVGSRVASGYGVEVVNNITQELAEAEIAVVSGGAFGIDAAAHRAALALGVPTIAVMAGGVSQMYPSSNEMLFQRMLETDAIVSEVAPGTAPTKWRFLQRNRLIASLSQASVIVEAGYRSGAINTANHALEIGRSLGAVPGSIMAAGSAGTNRLIAEGKARLIAKPKDVVDLLGANDQLFDDDLDAASLDVMPIEKRVLDAIGTATATIATICISAGLTTREALLGLQSLQKRGFVTPHGTRWAKL